MEALSVYLNYFTYAPIAIFLFSLAVCWKSIGARWFLTLLVTVECIDLYTSQFSIKWTTHYYIWSAFIGLLFLTPSFYRSSIAQKVYSYTKKEFFHEASKLKFTQQEAAILIISFLSMFANLVSYVEILMYKYYVIDMFYFKQYILDNLQLFLHILVCLAALSFSFTSSKGHKNEAARA